MSISLPIAFFSSNHQSPPIFLGNIIYSIHVPEASSPYPNSNFLFGKFSSINSVSLSGFALLNSNGDVDNVFKPYLSNPFGEVRTAAVSAGSGDDFKFIVGVSGGVENRINTSSLAVINLSSSGGFFSDNTFFNTNQPNNQPHTIYIRDKIYLGGLFTQIGLTTRQYFAAFELNGTLSTLRFNANSFINVIKPDLSPSTDLFMGGAFTTVTRYNVSPASTSTRRGLIKITTAGGITSFNANGIFTNTILVNAIEVMSDGRVIVGSANNSIKAKNLVILAANTISTTTTYVQFQNLLSPLQIDECHSLKIDNSGRLLACIDIFNTSTNQYQTRLYRFNITPSVSIDTSFAPGTFDGYLPLGDFTAFRAFTNRIFSINLDSNNRIILGGNFSTINSISRNLYAVLDNNGSVLS